MDRETLIARMVELLVAALDAEGERHEMQAAPDSPLVGGDAVLSSLALVTYILDVESWAADEHDIHITLVNEQALSRRNSPFRTVETLADYVAELAGIGAAAAEDEAKHAAQG